MSLHIDRKLQHLLLRGKESHGGARRTLARVHLAQETQVVPPAILKGELRGRGASTQTQLVPPFVRRQGMAMFQPIGTARGVIVAHVTKA